MKKSSSFSVTALSLGIAILFASVNGIAQNTRSVNDAHGLQVGSLAPDYQAIDSDSITLILADALKKGPVVMIFYRGQWCPYCTKHLSTIQDSLKLITDRGATVVAISPQRPEYLREMVEKTGASFRLLYDERYAISDAYDVTYTPTTRQLIRYNTGMQAKLKETQTDDSQRMPIPATYLIDHDGVIVWRHFDPDYKNRSTIKEILEHLPD